MHIAQCAKDCWSSDLDNADRGISIPKSIWSEVFRIENGQSLPALVSVGDIVQPVWTNEDRYRVLKVLGPFTRSMQGIRGNSEPRPLYYHLVTVKDRKFPERSDIQYFYQVVAFGEEIRYLYRGIKDKIYILQKSKISMLKEQFRKIQPPKWRDAQSPSEVKKNNQDNERALLRIPAKRELWLALFRFGDKSVTALLRRGDVIKTSLDTRPQVVLDIIGPVRGYRDELRPPSFTIKCKGKYRRFKTEITELIASKHEILHLYKSNSLKVTVIEKGPATQALERIKLLQRRYD
jgi:hypothetical protein